MWTNNMTAFGWSMIHLDEVDDAFGVNELTALLWVYLCYNVWGTFNYLRNAFVLKKDRGSVVETWRFCPSIINVVMPFFMVPALLVAVTANIIVIVLMADSIPIERAYDVATIIFSVLGLLWIFLQLRLAIWTFVIFLKNGCKHSEHALFYTKKVTY